MDILSQIFDEAEGTLEYEMIDTMEIQNGIIYDDKLPYTDIDYE